MWGGRKVGLMEKHKEMFWQGDRNVQDEQNLEDAVIEEDTVKEVDQEKEEIKIGDLMQVLIGI